MSNELTTKQLLIYSAILDILKIFADTEIGGQYDFNYEEIANYLNSLKSINDYWECDTKEDIYERFTDDIYNGYPVWRMLKLSPWTAKMVEKSFTDECEKLYQNECKKYKCLTCKYYKIINTMLGPLDNCTYVDPTKSRGSIPHRREPFKLKKRCSKYVVKGGE